jgi:hypothetical protein
MPIPEAAVSRTPPAIRTAFAGRACAKRMKRPTSASLLLRGDAIGLFMPVRRLSDCKRRLRTNALLPTS